MLDFTTTRPCPRVPLAPVLSRASFARARGALPCVLDAGQARFVTSGRVAIALALQRMGVGPGDAVLVPAWHSLSMVAPVEWLGAQPVFYRVGIDATPDLADIAARCAPNVKALMVTHYFGFLQKMDPLRALCDARGIGLLEDCAHCFFGERDGHPVGSYGDYAIASTMKFFPVYEGGCLVSARHSLAPLRQRGAGAGFEAKAALAALEHSFTYRRLPALRAALWLPMALKDLLWRRLKARRGTRARELAPASSDSSAQFDPWWLDKRSSTFSRLMLGLVSRGRIVALRRRHYLRLEAELGALPGCRPLYPRLPDGVCPWLFPLLVDDPEPLFARLVAAGVPVVRFAESLHAGVDASAFPDSAALSRKVLSLPCHQELHQAELDWIVREVRKAVLA